MFFFNGCNGVILVFFDGKEDFLVIEERVSDKENSIVDQRDLLELFFLEN